MSSVVGTPTSDAPDLDIPRRPHTSRTTGDRVFRGVSVSAAFVSLVIISATAIFLVAKSLPVFRKNGVVNFFTKSIWVNRHFGVLGLVLGTLLIAAVALFVAVPLALSMALFINEYAPKRMRTILVTMVDLLAALPSLIFGIWGFFALQGRLVGVAKWLSSHLNAIPLFRLRSADSAVFAQSTLVAGVVVGIMITPIITSVTRDVMSQAPREQCEGALALGGSRWGMIRSVIFPFARSGMVGAVLLGFGRALGETIAVAIIISKSTSVNWHITESGGGSIAAFIATSFQESGDFERGALVAAGLALFIMTLLVNLVARRIVASRQAAA